MTTREQSSPLSDMDEIKKCPICFDAELKPNVTITCFNESCKYQVCKECISTYLLGLQTKAKCMACSVALPDSFLKSIGGKFVKEHKARQKDILYQQARTTFPNYQNSARLYKTLAPRLKRVQESLKHTSKMWEHIKKEKHEARLKYEEEIERIDKKYKDEYNYKSHLPILSDERRVQLDLARIKAGLKKGSKKDETPEFLHGCPVEGCLGFSEMKNGLMRCGICYTTICDNCGCVKDAIHKCDSSAVKSLKHIRESTRQCPGCHAPVHKISGCNQMFCTKCTTTFDYLTGKVERGIVHNPHYFEWISRHGGARPGGECANQAVINDLLMMLKRSNERYFNLVRDIWRIGIDGRVRKIALELHNFRGQSDFTITKHLAGEATKDEVTKALLQKKRADERFERHMEVQHGLRTMITALILQMVEETKQYERMNTSAKNVIDRILQVMVECLNESNVALWTVSHEMRYSTYMTIACDGTRWLGGVFVTTKKMKEPPVPLTFNGMLSL